MQFLNAFSDPVVIFLFNHTDIVWLDVVNDPSRHPNAAFANRELVLQPGRSGTVSPGQRDPRRRRRRQASALPFSGYDGGRMDFDITKRVLAALEAHHVRYAVFGAVALNLHGLARFTADLDLFVEPTAENIERLRTALKAVLDDPAIDDIATADLLGEYPAVQYNPPDASFHIDILTRLGDAYSFADLKVEQVALDDVMVSVVTPQTLYEMKRDTVRLKDKADAQALKQRFGLSD